MSQPEPGTGATRAELPSPAPQDASTAELQQAAPPLPTATVESLKTDVAMVKDRVSR